ncbi:hypothetical protein LOTGIDRAFT_160147 [Lottia gigantea]|uniref:Uncharacterized protein n=1 Tax=Lottia gigantea TaxID=225164 RepID=V4AN05_LOTGI|nr:hypothetical protein LOTGIDRAFT_160147 [Lottia gigantea]ESO96160.1 hypothetical protein LOTGIDRAFT_160147 [Lottia gigantea]
MPLNFFKKRSKKMPFFRSQSDEAKRRLQHQLYLAQENPEPEFDISGCQIAEIPSSVFSLCRILYKEVLLLYDNWLTSIDTTGKLSDLQSLKVLDLHKNEIKHLPQAINHLHNLKVNNN